MRKKAIWAGMVLLLLLAMILGVTKYVILKKKLFSILLTNGMENPLINILITLF